MKASINRHLLAWVCVPLCILAVGCRWLSEPPNTGASGDEAITGPGSGPGDGGGAGDSGNDSGDTADEGGGDGATTIQKTGTLRVLITDKPFPVESIDAAWITITRVNVHRVGDDDADTNGVDDDDGDHGDHDDDNDDADTNGAHDDNDDDDDADTNGAHDDDDDDDDADTSGLNHDDDDDEGDDDDGGSNGFGDDCGSNGAWDEGCWFTVSDDEQAFDLLQLRNGQTDLLAVADIPVGTYNQIRLLVTEGKITLSGCADSNGVSSNGVSFPHLRVPSGEQTGIKLHFEFEIVEGQETTLLLDVDLSRAFKPVPGHYDDPCDIENFIFSPSLGMRLINVVNAGAISGTVIDADSNALPGVSVTAFDDGTDVPSTSTDENGAYQLSGLLAGTYRVQFSMEGYTGVEVLDVVVIAGHTTEGVNALLTQAEP